jgi:membrane-associated phospholipid phosphatase
VTRAARFARLVTSALEPATWTVVLAAVIGWHTARLPGLGWGLLGAGFAAVIPEVFIHWGLHRGHWADRHVPVRHERIIVLSFIIVSVSTGLILLAGLGAPWPVTAAVLIMLIIVIVLLAITTVWKISIHTATAASSSLILIGVYGPAAIPVYLLVILTGWSRITLRAHTLAQVLAGAALGTAFGFAYLALR